MVIDTTQAQKILTGHYTFNQLGFSLLITRWKRIYSNDSSTSTLQACVKEANVFLEKYAVIMEEDFATISKL
ncbi:MAG: hypothetical protein FWG49_05510 [Leptospirales bacterium]|nr:hypothetical protein [Leptospirales bacterium]